MKKWLIFTLFAIIGTGCTNNSPSLPTSPQVLTVSAQGDGNLGEVEFGTVVYRNFLFTNDSPSTVSLTPALSGPQADDFSVAFVLGCAAVDPGKSCMVKILFNATNKVAQTYQATLTVDDAQVSLQAIIPSVPSPSYQIYFNNQLSSSIDLGTIGPRQVKFFNVKVKNNSPVVGSGTLAMSNPDFRLAYNNCIGVTLKPSQVCYAVGYIQGTSTAQTSIGNLTFADQTVGLSVVQEVPVLSGDLQVLSTELDLGNFTSAGDPILKTIILINQGTGEAQLDNIDLPTGYNILYHNCNSVKPSAKCYVKLSFVDNDFNKGLYQDTLTFNNSQLTTTYSQIDGDENLASITVQTSSEMYVGQCVPVNLNFYDSQNVGFISAVDKSISLNLPTYSDASCASSQAVTLSAYSYQATTYVKPNAPLTGNVTATYGTVSGSSAVTVYAALQASASPLEFMVSQSSVLTISGGKTPYQISPSIGSVVSQVFSSATPGAASVVVTDQLGQSQTLNFTINPNLQLSAGTCSYAVPESVDCQVAVSGGFAPYSFSTTQGQINASTGSFYGVCVNNSGADTVTVVDSKGNSQQVSLTYPCVYKSCNQILAEGYGLTSGTYWLDPDALRSGISPVLGYCDMTYDQGGWLLVSSNNAGSTLIPGGTSRNNSLYELDTTTPLGMPDPESDYIIGSVINSLDFMYARVIGYGQSAVSNNSITLDNRGTWIAAQWTLTGSGANRLNSVVAKANVTVTGNGTLSSNANYYVLDAVKMDRLNSGFGANSNQSTIGGAGVQTVNGDPTGGTYFGHGATEGSYEGWYTSGNSNLDARGYNTWVKANYNKYPVSCHDAFVKGSLNLDGNNGSGIYQLDLDGANYGIDSFTAYCDMGTTSYKAPWQGATLVSAIRTSDSSLALVDNQVGAPTTSFYMSNAKYQSLLAKSSYIVFVSQNGNFITRFPISDITRLNYQKELTSILPSDFATNSSRTSISASGHNSWLNSYYGDNGRYSAISLIGNTINLYRGSNYLSGNQPYYRWNGSTYAQEPTNTNPIAFSRSATDFLYIYLY